MTDSLNLARELVAAQAKDDGLWFHASTAPEAYLQTALRALHAVVGDKPPDEAAMDYLMDNCERQGGAGMMGEIADMMLDGTLCACCGCELGQDTGYPIYCDGCKPDFIDEHPKFVSTPRAHECGFCGKRFRQRDHMHQHARDKHGAEEPA